MWWISLYGAALGADGASREVPAGAFVIDRSDARVEVHTFGLPKPIGIDPRYRVCKVVVNAVGGAAASAVRDGCHPNLVDAVTAAASSWSFEVTKPPERDRELFEYWYVFPEARGGAVRLFVRQAWDQGIVLTLEDVDLLAWGVKGRVFFEYPEEAARQDTTFTHCDVKVDIAASGVPGAIEINDCDEVFHPEVLDVFRRWRFKGPELDGVPFASGVTFGVQFTRSIAADGPPGTAEIRFPPDPDLGGRTLERLEEPVWVEPEPPPDPTWPAKFVMDHKSYAQVKVFDLRWPDPVNDGEEHTCDVLFQVNSRRRVWAWAEESCDPTVRSAVEAAAGQWILKSGVIDEGERFARFRGTFVFPSDGGHVVLRVPEGDVVTPVKDLPTFVTTFVTATAVKRVAPKLPPSFATEATEAVVLCEFDVTVDPSGHAGQIDTLVCPGGYAPYAERALRQWRWIPAESGGRAIESRTLIRIRFEQPGGDG